MKIPKKILDRYDMHAWPCANDSWNIANNYPTNEQRKFLNKVHNAKYGICGGHKKITMKDIKEYNEIHNWQLVEV